MRSRTWGDSGGQPIRSARLPEGMRLHRVYSLVNGAKAVCLWEGESADAVGDLVDQFVGDCSRNEFYEVDRRFWLPREQA
jgi:hypothetical protein